jgi:hypothetical protein
MRLANDLGRRIQPQHGRVDVFEDVRRSRMDERDNRAELSAEEAEALQAEALPDREAMSVLNPGKHFQPLPPEAIGITDPPPEVA